jgi:hypothetical protein
MVGPGAAMNQDQRRLLPYHRPFGDHADAFDVDEEADAVDTDIHWTALPCDSEPV